MKNFRKIQIFSFFFIFQVSLCNENSIFFINPQSHFKNYFFYQQLNDSNFTYSNISPNRIKKIDNKILKTFFDMNDQFEKGIKWKLNNSFFYNNGLRKQINGTILLELMPNLNLQNDFEFDSNGYDDVNYSGHQVETIDNWTGYLQHSSISWFNNFGHFFIGKTNIAFSNSNSSIILNPYSPPSETVWLNLNNEKISYDYALIFLDSVESQKRMITFKRYCYNKEKIQIGLTELVIFSYDSFGKDEYSFIFPASILLENEINGNKNSNLFWAIDFRYKMNKKTFYVEFLIDDFAIDNLSPPKLAGKVSFYRNYPNLLIGIDYTRINRWVGNYHDRDKRMINENVLLGNQIGPDAHSLEFLFNLNWNNSTFIFSSLMFVEKGNSDINDWPENIGSSSNFGYNSEPFPSRPIKSNIIFDFKIDRFFSLKKFQFIFFKELIIEKIKKPNIRIGFVYKI